MKPRHQSFPKTARRVVTRDESGAADVEVPTFEAAPEPIEQASIPLKNVELRRDSRGQFLIFKTNRGDRFALNLDCQEEFGFEAKEVLLQWASEQPGA